MTNTFSLEQCLEFVNCHLRQARSPAQEPAVSHPRAVTISRQTGSGAVKVAEKLAGLLQAQSPKDTPLWTVFDHNLMEKVLEDHDLPARLARHLPEDRISELQDITDELFGLRPASWTVIQQTSETILHLAELGNVIIIGRGANIITARLPDVLHVRLVAPAEQRVRHAREIYNVTAEEAHALCLRRDRGRRRYLKKYFDADIDDPLLYHLTINTGLISYDDAARLIAETALAGPRGQQSIRQAAA